MDPKHLHDTRKKLNDLAISHNRLTTLAACLLNEVQSLRKEVNELKGIKTVPDVQSSQQHHQQQMNPHQMQQRMQQPPQRGGMGGRQQSNQYKYDPNNIASLKADEILSQLHLGHD